MPCLYKSLREGEQLRKVLKFVGFINMILIVIIDKSIFLWYTAIIVLEREG